MRQIRVLGRKCAGRLATILQKSAPASMHEIRTERHYAYTASTARNAGSGHEKAGMRGHWPYCEEMTNDTALLPDELRRSRAACSASLPAAPGALAPGWQVCTSSRQRTGSRSASSSARSLTISRATLPAVSLDASKSNSTVRDDPAAPRAGGSGWGQHGSARSGRCPQPVRLAGGWTSQM